MFYLLIYLFIWFGFLGGRFVCIFLSSLPGGIVSALRASGAGSIFLAVKGFVVDVKGN